MVRVLYTGTVRPVCVDKVSVQQVGSLDTVSITATGHEPQRMCARQRASQRYTVSNVFTEKYVHAGPRTAEQLQSSSPPAPRIIAAANIATATPETNPQYKTHFPR